MYDKDYLDNLIANKVEEDTHLDYKASAALYKQKGDELYKDITKDVSSFANADGGILIYGISEDKEHRHLPAALDPVDRSKVSREWLEQIIQNKISPRLDVTIHAIPVSENPNEVVYLINVPKGSTAYQASDKRYYRRANSISQPMDDYEVKDVINRVKHPKIDLEFVVHRARIEVGTQQTFEYQLKVYARNLGRVYAKYINCDVIIPEQCLHGTYQSTYANVRKATFFGQNTNGLSHNPLLPLRKIEISFKIPPLAEYFTDYPHAIEWTVYADNAEPNHGTVAFSDVPQKHV